MTERDIGQIRRTVPASRPSLFLCVFAPAKAEPNRHIINTSRTSAMNEGHRSRRGGKKAEGGAAGHSPWRPQANTIKLITTRFPAIHLSTKSDSTISKHYYPFQTTERTSPLHSFPVLLSVSAHAGGCGYLLHMIQIIEAEGQSRWGSSNE